MGNYKLMPYRHKYFLCSVRDFEPCAIVVIVPLADHSIILCQALANSRQQHLVTVSRKACKQGSLKLKLSFELTNPLAVSTTKHVVAFPPMIYGHRPLVTPNPHRAIKYKWSVFTKCFSFKTAFYLFFLATCSKSESLCSFNQQ